MHGKQKRERNLMEDATAANNTGADVNHSREGEHIVVLEPESSSGQTAPSSVTVAQSNGSLVTWGVTVAIVCSGGAAAAWVLAAVAVLPSRAEASAHSAAVMWAALTLYALPFALRATLAHRSLNNSVFRSLLLTGARVSE